MIQSNILLTDVEIPVYDNLVSTNISLNTNSPSNNDILPLYETVDEIPTIIPGDGSIFPDNPEELPNTQTLQELLQNLSEVMVRFNTSPDYYQKDDYRILINTITNSLIHLYLGEQETNSYTSVVPFIGIAELTTNPFQDALNKNNRFPGIYFVQVSGNYINFGITITPTELLGSVVMLLPIISNNTFVSYQKQIYTIDLSAIVTDKYYRHTQGISASVWNVKHNLNKYPSVTVLDSAGTLVHGQVSYTDNNNIILTFSAAFSGTAEIN